MTEYKLYKDSDPLKNLLLWILLSMLIYWLISCTREIQKSDNYEMVTMWYNTDTTNQRIHEVIQLNENRPQWIKVIEGAKDSWGMLCGTEILQQIFYRKNGKKIQPSKYPL